MSSLYLELELLGGNVVDLAGGVLVHHGELGAAGGQVQAPDGGADLQQVHGEGIVDENLEDLAVFQAEQEALALRRSAHHLRYSSVKDSVVDPVPDQTER